MEKLSHIKDVHALLDEVLLHARQLIRADAGSIYLIENNVLNFSYTHNDTLFGTSGVNRQLYQNHTLPVDNHSLAGYVALTGEPLLIDDAYHLPAGMPFTFNNAFDQMSGYRTQSILVAPLVTSNNKTVGVMQIINPLSTDRSLSHFHPQDQLVLSYFANNAASAIERALLTREIRSPNRPAKMRSAGTRTAAIAAHRVRLARSPVRVRWTVTIRAAIAIAVASRTPPTAADRTTDFA